MDNEVVVVSIYGVDVDTSAWINMNQYVTEDSYDLRQEIIDKYHLNHTTPSTVLYDEVYDKEVTLTNEEALNSFLHMVSDHIIFSKNVGWNDEVLVVEVFPYQKKLDEIQERYEKELRLTNNLIEEYMVNLVIEKRPKDRR